MGCCGSSIEEDRQSLLRSNNPAAASGTNYFVVINYYMFVWILAGF
jgi:hypothetical protein